MAKFDPERDFPEAWKLCKPFMVSDEALASIRDAMTKEVQNGLGRDTHSRSSIPCLLSYVQQLPTGWERGRFLALEVLQTNCRIMLVKFNSEKDIYMSSKSIIVPHTIAGSRGLTLFKFLAENIAIFVREKKVEKDNLPMGIAFAFELNKLSLDVGILLAWSKGYGANAAIGKDVVQLLRDALAEHKDIRIDVNCIVNISTGSLMAVAWSHINCRMGLLIGNGTNAAYVEQTSECDLYEGDPSVPLMIINTQWGNFGANGQLDFIRNEFDKIMDAESAKPGHYFYEKCISTIFVAELVRLIIVRLMNMGVIFKEYNQDYVGIHWKMEMKSIIAIESDPPGVYVKVQETMDKFRMNNCQERDLATVRFICQVVSSRSAKLVAAGVACLVNRMNYPNISIAVDGGIYRLYPNYQKVLNKCTTQLAKPSNNFEFVIAQDSAGVGAAIVAGLARHPLFRIQRLS